LHQSNNKNKQKKVMERLVLIGIDDSSDALAAFDYYVGHLHRPRNKVILLHVVKPFIIKTNQTTAERKLSREQAEVNEKQTLVKLQQRYQDRMKLNSIPGRINVISYSREPGKILCQVAAEDRCNYIVVGCRVAVGKTGSQGDVIDHLLRKAKCPVVIVRSIHDDVTPSYFPEVAHQYVDYRSSALADERRRRISCPSKFSTSQKVDSPLSSHVGPGLAQPIRQRRHSTFLPQTNVAEQLALLDTGKRRANRSTGVNSTSSSATVTERRLSVKFEEDEEADPVCNRKTGDGEVR
jgi:nucleotide-binding universal stress UspA family protein